VQKKPRFIAQQSRSDINVHRTDTSSMQFMFGKVFHKWKHTFWYRGYFPFSTEEEVFLCGTIIMGRPHQCNKLTTIRNIGSLFEIRMKSPPTGERLAMRHESDCRRLLGHIDTPELNPPRNDFALFLLQHTNLSNTSNKFIFPRPIASCYLSQSFRSALWVNSLSAFALVNWQFWR